MKDATKTIREAAAKLPNVVVGTSCTQTSFKTHGKSAFLYIGEQGGRYKAMFKLDASISEAQRLAKDSPDDFQVGSTAWVTARFSNDQPLPKKLWTKWLKESYGLTTNAAQSKSVKHNANTDTTRRKKSAKKKLIQKKK